MNENPVIKATAKATRLTVCMIKYCIVVLVVLQGSVVLAQINGLGSSTPTCLDKDGDGYGIGPGCANGPDADDNDATVQAFSDGVTKYGSAQAFLAHLGYTPTRIWVLTTSGNDSTCISTTPSAFDLTHPCLTITHVNSVLSAGDMVLFRAGTWTNQNINVSASGTSGNPIVFLAYPGELVTVQQTGSNQWFITNLSYITFDGIRMQELSASPDVCISGGGVSPGASHGITVVNNEGVGCKDLIIANGLDHATIVGNLIRDNPNGEHGIYLGANNATPVSTDILVKQNIIYNMGTVGGTSNGIHWNGPCTSNCEFSQNFIYKNAVAAISLQNGFANGKVINNVLVGYGAHALELDANSGNCLTPGPICPHSETGNVIENNTIYITGHNVDGSGNGQPGVKIVNESYDRTIDLGHNTYRNNIIVSYNTCAYPPIAAPDLDENYIGSSTFNKNIFWSLSGAGNVWGYGIGTAICGFGYLSYSLNDSTMAANFSSGGGSQTGNQVADPTFTSASGSFWNSVSSFVFQPGVGSPAWGTASTTGVPTYDLLGATRSSTPTIGAYDIGWVPLPNKLSDFCTAHYGSYNCVGNTNEYSGAAADTSRNHYLFIGGGRSVNDNSVYQLDITQNPPSWSIHTPQSSSFVSDLSCTGIDTEPDGKPKSRHTYYNLVYHPVADIMYMWDGGNYDGDCRYNKAYWLDLTTTPGTWHAVDPANSSGANPPVGPPGVGPAGGVMNYISTTQDIFMWLTCCTYTLMKYHHGDGTTSGGNRLYTIKNTSVAGELPTNGGGAYDPLNTTMYYIGQTATGGGPVATIGAMDPTGSGTIFPGNQYGTSTGCSVPANFNFYPGVEWDNSLSKIVVYEGTGNTVWVYDPVANSCTSQVLPGGPTATNPQGLMGKMKYFPAADAFVVMVNADSPQYILRLSANPPCTISPSSLGPWTVGQVISQTFTNSGCSSSSWSSSGTWPTGISFNTSTGVASGTVGGSPSTFTPSVSYDTATNNYSIVVNAAPSITTSCPLTTGTQGIAYSQTLTSTGGTAPITWAKTSGTYQAGLNGCNAVTGTTCLISGTPSASGTATLTFTATDSNGVVATLSSCGLTINPAATITSSRRAGTARRGGASR